MTGVTIFEAMSALAREHDAVNLGQGFPDFGWPETVLDAAAAALRNASNQYPPMRGLPVLREAVARHYSRHQQLDVTAEEVIVTSGATEALAASLLALIEPGDEVVLLEPLYDAYLPLVRQAGGVPRIVTLTPPDWRIDPHALAAAITPRTRVLILNNPHNPAAAVFGEEQLRIIADACVRHDLIAVCDEVWEHVLFDGRTHANLMTMPGMRERTVKIGSAGKILALTGWKVGWVIAAPPLAERIVRLHQYLAFTTPPNLQAAVAVGLDLPPEHFVRERSRLEQCRDRLVAHLGAAGFATLPSQGTYFLTVDLAASGVTLDDAEFCERAVRETGVAGIPLSAFYAAAPERHLVRLCFAKVDATLDEGARRLAAARRLFAEG